MNISSEVQDSMEFGRSRLSIWSMASEPRQFPILSTDLSVDVVIIGAGITGITAAAQIARGGRTVAVLEAMRVGAGTTGNSTGNLYATVDQTLFRLGKKWGDDKVAAVVQSRISAIDLIERNIAEFRINCNFARQPCVLYSTRDLPSDNNEIEAEYDAAMRAGLDARLTTDLALPYMIKKAMVVCNQAQFNPLEYVRRLAAAVHSKQCEIFEESAVIEIDEQNGIVRTAAHSVTADHIVVATHTPKGFDVVHTELGPYREYAVAAALDRQPLPGGIFWSVGEQRTSTRAVILNGKRYVLMIGEKHKTGQNENPETSYQHLSDLMLARFDVQDISVKWSAQHYRAADGLPYIGSSAGAALVYIATGFGSDGLTYGTLAGMMIADEINGVDNPFAELYSPRRFTPVKSAKNFLKENLNVAGRYIKDYTRSADVKSFANLMRGEGGLVDAEGDKLAVYRDEFDHLHILSPVCTHLKCIVHWNRAERSWDCPCHGSRFDFDGNIIEGPALFPLQRHNVIADMDFDAPPLT